MLALSGWLARSTCRLFEFKLTLMSLWKCQAGGSDPVKLLRDRSKRTMGARLSEAGRLPAMRRETRQCIHCATRAVLWCSLSTTGFNCQFHYETSKGHYSTTEMALYWNVPLDITVCMATSQPDNCWDRIWLWQTVC